MIDEGRCIFFGPRERAMPYFRTLGFEILPRQTIADFLTAVADPRTPANKLNPASKTPGSAEERERCFQVSDEAKVVFESVLGSTQAKCTSLTRVPPQSIYTLPFHKQVQACATRQFQVLWGDKVSFMGKFFLTTFISLVFGSLFYDQPATTSGVFTRGGVVLYYCLFSRTKD